MKRRAIAITMGDPAGIGPEIILRSFQNPRIRNAGSSVIIGDIAVMDRVQQRLRLELPLVRISEIEELQYVGDAVPVLDQGVVEDVSSLRVGVVSVLGAKAARSYIEKAVQLAMDGLIRGIATGPINKEALRMAGFSSVGHTEMLSELSKRGKSVTMFMVNRLKIFFHTRHLSLKRVIATLRVDDVVESLVLAVRSLRSIGYKEVRIALAALNPHASDGGLFGHEEERILIPACESAKSMGIDVAGPVPADSVFHFALQGRYDAVVSLYHDQGHIAAKTYDFYRTVSVTLGLPFLRTSVDHGTAFDIAWQGIANPVSMEEAIRACFHLSERYRPITGEENAGNRAL